MSEARMLRVLCEWLELETDRRARDQLPGS